MIKSLNSLVCAIQIKLSNVRLPVVDDCPVAFLISSSLRASFARLRGSRDKERCSRHLKTRSTPLISTTRLSRLCSSTHCCYGTQCVRTHQSSRPVFHYMQLHIQWPLLSANLYALCNASSDSTFALFESFRSEGPLEPDAPSTPSTTTTPPPRTTGTNTNPGWRGLTNPNAVRRRTSSLLSYSVKLCCKTISTTVKFPKHEI